MIIKKVYEVASGQKLVSIPAKSEIKAEDYVMIIKVKGEQAVAEKNLSAIAKTSTESANQTKAKKILKEVFQDE